MAKYMAKISVTKLDQSRHSVETVVKADTIENLQRKVTTIVGLMDEDDLDPTGSVVTR